MRSKVYGIKNIEINDFCITTVNILCDHSFNEMLPTEVIVRKTAKGKTQIMYTNVACGKTNEIVNEIGRALKLHATKKMTLKYNWVIEIPFPEPTTIVPNDDSAEQIAKLLGNDSALNH